MLCSVVAATIAVVVTTKTSQLLTLFMPIYQPIDQLDHKDLRQGKISCDRM